MKVLLVEDERALAEAVTAVLCKNNYSVDNAYDGVYGLDCALTGIYDFIILDIMLPEMDGLTVLNQLRSAGVDTPV
jgi:DNA-binding response OmpR family regulator